MQVLERKWSQLEKELAAPREEENVVLHNTAVQIALAKKDLDLLWSEKTKGAMIRSRINWCEAGEKPSGYFLRLEKHNYNRKYICRLVTPQGEITEQNGILREQCKFYKDLYTTNYQQVREDYMDDLSLPQLDGRERSHLDRVLDLDEIKKAVKQLKSNKTLGTDGLPIEFYREFWNELKILLYYVYQEWLEKGKMHRSARRGIISLLEKPGKDPLNLANWCPLSLLNIDYKIYAKLVANRIQTILPKLIKPGSDWIYEREVNK